MPNARRPVIGITGPARKAWLPRACVATVLRLNGAQPKQLRPGDTLNGHELDGLVITGGHDIDPVLYAAEPEVHPNYDAQRDKFESDAIDYALANTLPLLGICRGAQLLNVRLGGSLHQELRSRRQQTSNRWTVLPLKTLKVESSSMLARTMGCTRCRINSLHNQAIDRLGRQLNVSGRDLDGIVQGIEGSATPFLLGVQWHPEFLLYQRSQRALFKRLIEAARDHITAR